MNTSNLTQRKTVSHEYLKEMLSYDAEAGIFSWKKNRKFIALAGFSNWKPDKKGYIKIFIDGRLYFAHRLAWLYVYGEYPSMQIDHINGIRNDNRICNLRQVTPLENCHNSIAPRKNNTTGYAGVSFNKAVGKYSAQIATKGIKTSLGFYENPLDAHKAYVRAKCDLHIHNERISNYLKELENA
jgi:hypothetical protein